MILQLRAIRKRKKLSQSELANLIGANLRTIGAWERGETMMSIEQLCRCCEALGVTPNDMTGWYIEHPGDAGSSPAAVDPMRDELVRCYAASTAENRHSLVIAARNAALASGDVAERGADKSEMRA